MGPLSSSSSSAYTSFTRPMHGGGCGKQARHGKLIVGARGKGARPLEAEVEAFWAAGGHPQGT